MIMAYDYGPASVRMLYFGSPSCEKCVRYYIQLKNQTPLNKKNFRFVNGDDFDNKEIQSLCDLHNVDEYPHVKIFREEECIYEQIGELNLLDIINTMESGVSLQNESKPTTNQSDQSQ